MGSDDRGLAKLLSTFVVEYGNRLQFNRDGDGMVCSFLYSSAVAVTIFCISKYPPPLR